MVLFTLETTVCVRICMPACVCVCLWRASRAAELTVPSCKARAVTVCMCLCQHDGGEGCYSDLMNPSAFKGHSSSRTQAGANKQRPGSPSSGWGAQSQCFHSRQSKGEHGLVLNTPPNFHQRTLKNRLFWKRGLRLKAVQSHTQPSCTHYCKLGWFLFLQPGPRGAEEGSVLRARTTVQLVLQESGSCWCPHLRVTWHPGQPQWRMDGGQEAGALWGGGLVGTEGPVIRMMNSELSGLRETSSGGRKEDLTFTEDGQSEHHEHCMHTLNNKSNHCTVCWWPWASCTFYFMPS